MIFIVTLILHLNLNAMIISMEWYFGSKLSGINDQINRGF